MQLNVQILIQVPLVEMEKPVLLLQFAILLVLQVLIAQTVVQKQMASVKSVPLYIYYRVENAIQS